MNTSVLHHMEESLLCITLDGNRPSKQTLIVNPPLRTVILWSQPPTTTTPMVVQQHFSPNEIRVLVPLLATYPAYCPYADLLVQMFSLPLETARQLLRERWEIAIRPIRRAINHLAAKLHALGLRVRNIRGAGYFIEVIEAKAEPRR